jgi:hypothetical protein
MNPRIPLAVGMGHVKQAIQQASDIVGEIAAASGDAKQRR